MFRSGKRPRTIGVTGMNWHDPHGIVGREEELAAVRALRPAHVAGPVALVIDGEPGIGKTTLWRAGVDAARELPVCVLTATPAEAETKLSFAALGDLLEGRRDALLALPAPQRHALEVALLLREADGSPLDQHAIALGFLGALRSLAPVTVAVDDLQWLDRPSAFVLEFALRRLRDEPVAFLLAFRSEHGREPPGVSRAILDGAERLRVGPLSLGAVHRLLSERLGIVISRPQLRRLHELSGGNPFFALELGRALKDGTIELRPGESLPGTLAALVHDRLGALPAETRAALVAAAALSQPTLELVGRAVGGDPKRRLASALAANVIELEGDRIRFSHPLLASGMYAAAGGAERRRLHRRLADLLPDLEERARHLALATEGPDQGVAVLLEDASRHARSRGALAAAADLAEQARRYTPVDHEGDRHRRTLQAAALAFETGDGGRAGTLFDEALAAAPAGPRRAEVLLWLGGVQQYEGDRRVTVELCRRGLAEAGDDVSVRCELERMIANGLFLMRTELPAATRHAQVALVLAEQIGDQARQMSAIAELAIIDGVRGRTGWRVALERAIALERKAPPMPLAGSALHTLAANLTWVGELGEARTIFHSLRDNADERGEESALPWILANLSLVEFLAGRWPEASRCAEEAIDIARQIDQEPQALFARGVRAMVRASRGEVEGAIADAEATLAVAKERGVMMATIVASSAVGLLELSRGHPDAVHAILGPLSERLEKGGVREPGAAPFLADEIEALIVLGRLEEAEALLDRIERRARRLRRAPSLASCARCRGLLAAARGDLDAALGLLERAQTDHDGVSMPFDHARTLLALGMTRRRAKRRRAARASLEAALAIFEQLGARLWAEMTQVELARIGGRRSAPGTLTATEQRIAELVAEGRSNREVAVALFVTPKTVSTKLSRIYAKVGVHSRTELTHHLAQSNRADKL